MLLDNNKPTNYEEVMMSPDSNKCLEAMKSEIGSMYENKVWTLVDFPNDRQAIENKCSDQTSNSLIYVHQCHPWIGNADTHNT